MPSSDDPIRPAHSDVCPPADPEAPSDALSIEEQIFAQVQEGIIVHAPDLTYRVWNPYMEWITGMPASEVLGRHPRDLFPFLQESGFLDHLERAFAGETVGPFDTPFHSPRTGKSGWCSDTLSPLRDAQGAITGLVVMVRENTQRKEAEEALRRSERTYKDQFVKNSAVMLLVDPSSGAIIDANEAAAGFYGYGREGLLAMRITDINLLPGAGVMRSISQITSRQGERFEFQHRLADGSVRDVQVMASNIHYGGRAVIHSIIFDITASKRAEEKLRRQSGLIASLLDSIPEIIFYKDTAGVYLGCNPPFAELVGRPRHEIIGRTDYDLFDREAAEFFRAMDRQMLRELQPRQNEEWVTYPDGRRVLFSTLKTPYRGPDGALIGLLGISHDITKRKLADQALQDAHWRLETLIEATRAGTWECNAQTGETVYSAVWAEITGYTLEELAPIGIGTWEALAHPDDLKRAREALRRHFAGELPYYDVECRIRHKDGSWVWVSDRGRVITRTEDGRPLLVLGTMTDITERMKAVEDLRDLNRELDALIQGRTQQLQQTLEELRHSEAHFRALADSAPIHIRTMDNEGRITYMNQTALDFHGLASQEEARGLDWLSRIHPEDRASVAPWSVDPNTQDQGRTWKYRILTPEGQYRWLLSKAVPDLGPHGECQGFVGSSVDITVHTESEELLRNLEGLKAKSQIAAYIAHEINNPLAGIKQSFQVLAQGIPASHPDYPFVGLISRELDRIASIVRMAYSIHRPGPPQVRDSNVADTLADLASLIVSRLRTKRLALLLPEPDPALKGRIHEDILRQILFNVIQNAIEASAEGGRVTCRARREERHLVVEVEDQGPGIAPELAPRIFQLGFSTKDGPEMGGLGTGLATCRSILHSIGGSIGFRNLDPGPGACFSIAIPWQ